MFTGIIETKGKIKNKIIKNSMVEVDIFLENEIKNPKQGMSIAVNGVCLTAKEIKNKFEFLADISEETLKKTTFNKIKLGDIVNIEFPVKVGEFLSGHIVTGHIDVKGKVNNILKKANNYFFEFEVPEEFKKYLIEKGSIAIDGVSLTMYDIIKNKFKVAVIPETFKKTIICYYKINTEVNIEFDIIGKYIEKLIKR